MLAILCMLWPGRAENEHPSTHATDNVPKQNQQIMPPPSAVVNPPDASPQRKTKPDDTENTTQVETLVWFKRPEWVIVWVTIIYVIVAALTLFAIRRQANIMQRQAIDARQSAIEAASIARDTLTAIERQALSMRRQTTHLRRSVIFARRSANAAKKSADALMEGERAWVTANIHQPSQEDMNIRGKAENWGLGVGLIFKNLGKTPSTVTNSYVRYDFVPSINPDSFPIIPKLPPEPDYSVERERGVIAPPGTVWMPRQKFDYCIVILKQDFREHLTQWEVSEKILCVYGFIDYVDAYQRPHTTRFCFAYLRIRAPLALMNEASGKLLFPPKFCLSGPDSYNRIT